MENQEQHKINTIKGDIMEEYKTYFISFVDEGTRMNQQYIITTTDIGKALTDLFLRRKENIFLEDVKVQEVSTNIESIKRITNNELY